GARRHDDAHRDLGTALCVGGFAPQRSHGGQRHGKISRGLRTRQSERHRAYESSWRSSVPAVSSISISRNSSESKISPHSRHSTNSVSSCRETIRTLGCLQALAIVLLSLEPWQRFQSGCSRPGIA